MVYADYGLTDRINVIATIPYVMTDTSQGVLASQSGWQDFTLAAKVRAVTARVPHFRVGQRVWWKLLGEAGNQLHA